MSGIVADPRRRRAGGQKLSLAELAFSLLRIARQFARSGARNSSHTTFMKIGIPKETAAGETRVAFVPALAGALVRDKHEILVESGAGVRAGVSDAQYTAAGAAIAGSSVELYAAADLVLKVHPPTVAEAWRRSTAWRWRRRCGRASCSGSSGATWTSRPGPSPWSAS